MRKILTGVGIALGLLGVVNFANASANTFTIQESQGTTFQEVLNVSVTKDDGLYFGISGSTSHFSSLSFSFLSGPTVVATTTGGVLKANFVDSSPAFVSGTYQVTISGQTKPFIDGDPGVGILTLKYANAVVSVVPEPETYAMFLAGLGLIGTIARRRRRQ